MTLANYTVASDDKSFDLWLDARHGRQCCEEHRSTQNRQMLPYSLRLFLKAMWLIVNSYMTDVIVTGVTSVQDKTESKQGDAPERLGPYCRNKNEVFVGHDTSRPALMTCGASCL